MNFLKQALHCRCMLWWVGITLILAIIVALTAPLWLPAIGKRLVWHSNPTNADVIVVLAGDPERLHYGLELYEQGLAPEIWYTGNFSETPMPSEAEFAKAFAIQQGVPENRFHLLTSTSTWEDAQATIAEAKQRNIHHILVVTSWYHSRRAACIFHKQLADTNIMMSFYATPTNAHTPENWWKQERGLVSVTNEYIKTVFYWWNYGLAPWECGENES